MVVVLLAVRLTGLEERRHGTWCANWLAYGAMSKASVPNPSIRGGEKEGSGGSSVWLVGLTGSSGEVFGPAN